MTRTKTATPSRTVTSTRTVTTSPTRTKSVTSTLSKSKSTTATPANTQKPKRMLQIVESGSSSASSSSSSSSSPSTSASATASPSPSSSADGCDSSWNAAQCAAANSGALLHWMDAAFASGVSAISGWALAMSNRVPGVCGLKTAYPAAGFGAAFLPNVAAGRQALSFGVQFSSVFAAPHVLGGDDACFESEFTSSTTIFFVATFPPPSSRFADGTTPSDDTVTILTVGAPKILFLADSGVPLMPPVTGALVMGGDGLAWAVDAKETFFIPGVPTGVPTLLAIEHVDGEYVRVTVNGTAVVDATVTGALSGSVMSTLGGQGVPVLGGGFGAFTSFSSFTLHELVIASNVTAADTPVAFAALVDGLASKWGESVAA